MVVIVLVVRRGRERGHDGRHYCSTHSQQQEQQQHTRTTTTACSSFVFLILTHGGVVCDHEPNQPRWDPRFVGWCWLVPTVATHGTYGTMGRNYVYLRKSSFSSAGSRQNKIKLQKLVNSQALVSSCSHHQPIQPTNPTNPTNQPTKPTKPNQTKPTKSNKQTEEEESQ